MVASRREPISLAECAPTIFRVNFNHCGPRWSIHSHHDHVRDSVIPPFSRLPHGSKCSYTGVSETKFPSSAHDRRLYRFEPRRVISLATRGERLPRSQSQMGRATLFTIFSNIRLGSGTAGDYMSPGPRFIVEAQKEPVMQGAAPT
ncbi:hypothetical protein CY34DRAFT_535348 [Suillus luteus UH-Slu-Lm8-n1]|uniref:Uncharacterized protein n=1 Tax=Suillus luteus UH-Slu-Lm8-n1 TaxID=930992 RepID=A0A0D0AUT1_9AGAM|nr:hypothetical protein CY34DRAFT_535348 [Suillus luteus UH-Slu-Lm8-n1]